MKQVAFALFLLLIQLSCKNHDAAEASILDVNLRSLTGGSFSFAELSKSKASIIIFLQPECPFCNSYGKTLRLLDSATTAQGVKLIGVVAGKNFSDEEIESYRKKHQLNFPILLDPEFVLTKTLNAITTPEAFLLDNKGNVRYRGMIDNWGYEIGKVRAKVTEFYLNDALQAYLHHQPVNPDSTKAIGCYIQ